MACTSTKTQKAVRDLSEIQNLDKESFARANFFPHQFDRGSVVFGLCRNEPGVRPITSRAHIRSCCMKAFIDPLDPAVRIGKDHAITRMRATKANLRALASL